MSPEPVVAISSSDTGGPIAELWPCDVDRPHPSITRESRSLGLHQKTLSARGTGGIGTTSASIPHYASETSGASARGCQQYIPEGMTNENNYADVLFWLFHAMKF